MTDQDQVAIRLGQDEFRLAESYEVHLSIFDQPSRFAASFGNSSFMRDLIARVPPETPFQIAIAGREQFSGYTDGFDANGDSARSIMAIEGRDPIKELARSDISKEQSFNAPTHRELIEKSIAELAIRRPFSAELVKVLSSNSENRRVVSGLSSLSAVDDVSEAALQKTAGATGNQFPVLRTKLAETYYSLLKRHLDAVGLFLWCGASGDFIVGLPNHKQPACARITAAGVKKWRYRRNNSPRYSVVSIYGHSSGHDHPRSSVKGAYTDDVLLDEGHVWTKVIRDSQVTSTAHAEHVAKKKLAEGRRAGFDLDYVVSGHTTTSLLSPGKRIAWAPDTVVQVDDERIGVHGLYWIEAVTHRRTKDGTETTLKLLEPDALIFGDSAI